MSSAAIHPFPDVALRPYQWEDSTSEPIFDPAKHLFQGGAWSLPVSHPLPGGAKSLMRQSVNETSVGASARTQNDALRASSSFGYSDTFKVLSDEGYQIAREILNREYEAGFVKPDRRIQLCLRGVTYRSPFLRAFSECPEISRLASSLAQEPLIIHPIISNHNHVNWGLPSSATGQIRNVDQWHQDSVSHVLIILMSDMTDSVGGDLELILKPPAEAFQLLTDTNNAIPDEYLLKVRFPGPGYGIFVTGSEIVHHVTPLIKSNSPRITLIQSFASADPWVAVDRTKWDYYANAVSADWGGYEWMHYQSWKLGSQLLSLPQRVAWAADNAAVASELRRISQGLVLAADQIERKVEEPKAYFEENSKM